MDDPISIPFPATKQSYRSAILLFGGFTQRRNPSNGIRAAFDDAYRRDANPRTRIEYFPWAVNPAEIAEDLYQLCNEAMRDEGTRPRIAIIGYLFGGATAAAVARHLWDISPISFEVDELVLIDPVARWFGRFGWTRALFPSTIRVAPIVNRVRWIRQRNPRFRPPPPFFFPFSHNVVVKDAAYTEIIAPSELDDEHIEIDNAKSTQAEIAGDHSPDRPHGGMTLRPTQ